MAGTFGVSFMPGAQGENGQEMDGTRRPMAARNPVQEAVKILSLRLPKVYGAQALAPQALLNAPGGMGMPGTQGNVTAQALAQLAGLSAPQIPTLRESGGSPVSRIPDQRALFGGGGSVSAPINLAGRTHVIPGQTTDGGVVELPGGRVDPLPSPAQPTSQAPQPFASPWERPGRNARLAEKYGFDVAGGGYDY